MLAWADTAGTDDAVVRDADDVLQVRDTVILNRVALSASILFAYPRQGQWLLSVTNRRVIVTPW